MAVKIMNTILKIIATIIVLAFLFCVVQFDIDLINYNIKFYRWGIDVDTIANKNSQEKVTTKDIEGNAPAVYEKILEKELTAEPNPKTIVGNAPAEEKLKWIATKKIIDNNVKAAQEHGSDDFSDVHYQDDVMQQEVVNDLIKYLKSQSTDAETAVNDLQIKGVDGITPKQRKLLIKLLEEQP